MQDAKWRKPGRVQKTFVISRRSLSSLDRVSKNFNAPRDALVEFSVQRLLPIIARERETHNKRKKILGDIEKHYKMGKALLKKIKDTLGEDDPIYHRQANLMAVYENTYSHIDSFIERGKIIEDFDPEALKEIFTVWED